MNKHTHRCCKQVREPGMWSRYNQCSRRASVTVEGKVYCKLHDPNAVAARNQKSAAKVDALSKELRRKWDCLTACHGIEDPKTVIPAAMKAAGQIEDIKTEISARINNAQLNGKSEIATAMNELRERIDSLTQ